MSKKIAYKHNQNLELEFELPCTKCSGKPCHKVMASVDEVGSIGHDAWTYDWVSQFQIVQCQGCKSISFRSSSTNSEELGPDEDGDLEYIETVRLFPTRLEDRKGFGDDLYLLPNAVRKLYEETFLVLSNDAPILASIGLRALIESVCKEKEAEGDNLHQRLENLVVAKVLTPASAQYLHKIRILGNGAAHDVKPLNESQLELAMDIVEHLLRDVFILPQHVDAHFKKD